MAKYYDNLQEYFDDAVAYLATMPSQSVDYRGTCVYHNKDTDSRCIVGQFSPQESEASFARMGVQGLSKSYPDLKGIAWPDCDLGIELAEELQEAHDSSINWNNYGFDGWLFIKQLAECYGLSFTRPNLEIRTNDDSRPHSPSKTVPV